MVQEIARQVFVSQAQTVETIVEMPQVRYIVMMVPALVLPFRPRVSSSWTLRWSIGSSASSQYCDTMWLQLMALWLSR